MELKEEIKLVELLNLHFLFSISAVNPPQRGYYADFNYVVEIGQSPIMLTVILELGNHQTTSFLGNYHSIPNKQKYTSFSDHLKINHTTVVAKQERNNEERKTRNQ